MVCSWWWDSARFHSGALNFINHPQIEWRTLRLGINLMGLDVGVAINAADEEPPAWLANEKPEGRRSTTKVAAKGNGCRQNAEKSTRTTPSRGASSGGPASRSE